MCAIRKELLIDFSELHSVEIECNCGTRIAIDLMSTTALNPSDCPGCNTELGDVKQTLGALGDLLRVTTYRKGSTIRVCVPLTKSWLNRSVDEVRDLEDRNPLAGR